MLKIIAEPFQIPVNFAPRSTGKEPLHLFFVTSEALPFSQTGGLGEVPPGLTEELAKRGHKIDVIIPNHTGSFAKAIKGNLKITYLPEFEEMKLEMGKQLLQAEVFLTSYRPKRKNPQVFLVDSASYDFFGARRFRQLYSHIDDSARYYFFSLVAANLIKPSPNALVHTHDWQTGFIHPLLKSSLLNKNVPTLHTIHNLAHHKPVTRDEFWKMTGLKEAWYPGLYSDKGISPTGSDLADPTWAALSTADAISTVSENYVLETLTEEYGYEFTALLQKRFDENRYHGIVNGIDKAWYPTFDQSNVTLEKPIFKQIVQQAFGLTEDPNAMLIMMAARLDDQKGFNLILPILEKLYTQKGINFQFVTTAEASDDIGKRYASELKKIAASPKMAGRIGFITPYNKELTKAIYAGADVSLVPSKFEPCGLVAPASIVNGTVPIGRKTGGIADVIHHGKTGFLFEGEWPTNHQSTQKLANELMKTIVSTYDLFKNKDKWNKFIVRMMQDDRSWKAPAKQYEALYYEILNRFKAEGHYRGFGNF